MIIHVDVITIISYILAVVSAIIVGVILRLPILPERPIRHSFKASIIFPTTVIALGLSAMVFKLGWEGMIVGIIIGIVSTLISKYLLGRILPIFAEPDEGESNE
ncbi:MAG: energy-converting NiFe hydrogenase A subunit EhaA [Methanobacterium sp.]|uniref:energy-converting hydrogenase A subunit A EhaA n=1 Tax=Methanobacterium sp. TaxID=2164 RepID=UPI003D6552CC|nr:energy-converting NiFe hydrogenase A subunit EhaA [Methanobacterium sp.]